MAARVSPPRRPIRAQPCRGPPPPASDSRRARRRRNPRQNPLSPAPMTGLCRLAGRRRLRPSKRCRGARRKSETAPPLPRPGQQTAKTAATPPARSEASGDAASRSAGRRDHGPTSAGDLNAVKQAIAAIARKQISAGRPNRKRRKRSAWRASLSSGRSCATTTTTPSSRATRHSSPPIQPGRASVCSAAAPKRRCGRTAWIKALCARSLRPPSR